MGQNEKLVLRQTWREVASFQQLGRWLLISSIILSILHLRVFILEYGPKIWRVFIGTKHWLFKMSSIKKWVVKRWNLIQPNLVWGSFLRLNDKHQFLCGVLTVLWRVSSYLRTFPKTRIYFQDSYLKSWLFFEGRVFIRNVFKYLILPIILWEYFLKARIYLWDSYLKYWSEA